MAHSEQPIENPRHKSEPSKMELQAGFLALPSGRLFVLRYKPARPRFKSAIVLCPPFAEELNKSRRLINMQARKFCDAGFTVIVFDLFGTGDSEGVFAEASITHWKENYLDILQWLKSKGFQSCIVWGIRLGALFAAHLQSAKILQVEQIVLWQPELSGLIAIRQFLRLQSAANMLSDKKGMSVSELEKQLEAGQSIEVAGYGISSALYTQMKSLELATDSFDHNCPVHWLQLLSPPQKTLPVRVNKVVEQWQSEGRSVELHTVEGSNFWSPAELVVVPELINLSITLVGNSKGRKDSTAYVT